MADSGNGAAEAFAGWYNDALRALHNSPCAEGLVREDEDGRLIETNSGKIALKRAAREMMAEDDGLRTLSPQDVPAKILTNPRHYRDELVRRTAGESLVQIIERSQFEMGLYGRPNWMSNKEAREIEARRSSRGNGSRPAPF